MAFVITACIIMGTPRPASNPPGTNGGHQSVAFPKGGVELTSDVLAPYAPGEFWGGGNPVESCTTCNLNQVMSVPTGTSLAPNQDVDPFTGNYNFSDTLFSVPAVSSNLGVTLTYNSGAAQSDYYAETQERGGPGIAGYGWAFNALPSAFPGIAADGANQETVSEENGAQVVFEQAGSGGCPASLDGSHHTVSGSTLTYCAAGRVDAQFGKTSSGGFIFEYEGGRQVTTFDMYGQAVSEGDDHSTSDLVVENASAGTNGCPTSPNNPQNYPCEILSDTNASPTRSTAIVMEGSYVAGIQDPLGHFYSFNYQDWNGFDQLGSIDGPLGENWTFGYTGGSGTSPYQVDLTSITDPDNNTTHVSYNSVGMANYATDPSGAHETTYAYTNTSCPSSTCSSVPLTQHTTVTYPTGEVDVDNYWAGLLVSDSFGSGTAYTSTYYDSVAYNYVLPTSPEGNTIVTIVHPGAQSAAKSSVVTTDAVGDVLSAKDPNGTILTNIYDGSDFDDVCFSVPAGVSTAGASCGTPLAGATSYKYDSQGDLTSATDPLGHITSYAYNGLGQLCDEAAPTVGVAASCSSIPAGSTQYQYDTYGNTQYQTDAVGTSSATTNYAVYNADDEMTESVPGDGNVSGANQAQYETAYTYYGDGRLETMTAPLSRQTTYTYDAAGNVLTETDPAGVTTATYDGDDRTCWTYRAATAVGSPSCNNDVGPTGSVEYQYLADTTSATKITDQNNNSTTYQYSNPSFPTKPTAVLDAASIAPVYDVFDANGNICLSGPVNVYTGGQPACAWQSQETFDTFDIFGNRLTERDPNGNATTYTYSDAAYPTHVTSGTDPLGNTTRYVYDADGDLTVTEKPGGDAVTTGYDADNRPCWQAPAALFLPPQANGQCATPSGTGVSLFSYYPTSQRSAMIDNAGTPSQATTSYSYDASGNLLSSTDDNGKSVAYQYDTANDLTCIAYPVATGPNCNNSPSSTNTVVDRSPDSDGRLHSTTDWLGNTITYGYDPSNNVTGVTYPSGTGESVTYNYSNQLTLASAVYAGSVVGSQTETWSPNADELVSSNTVPASLTASGTGYTSSPSYNDLKNVSAATNPTTPSGADSYTYYPNGQLETDQPPGQNAITYAYNAGDQLASVTNPNSGVTSTYAYTADGERCWSKGSNISNPSCSSPPSGATSYGWNAFGQLCWSGNVASSNSCSAPPNGTTAYGYNGDGLRMTSTTSANTQYFTWDTGSASDPLLLEDGTNAYVYGPELFGGNAPVEQISLSSHQPSFLTSTPAGVQVVFNASDQLLNKSSYSTYGVETNSASSAASPFGFQGGYTDPSGLVYFIHRYYDPSTSQFISVDPLEMVTGQPFAFADSDPINYGDPSGAFIQGDGGQSCNAGARGTVCDPANTAIQQSLHEGGGTVGTSPPKQNHPDAASPNSIPPLECDPHKTHCGGVPSGPSICFSNSGHQISCSQWAKQSFSPPSWPMEVIDTAGGVIACGSGVLTAVCLGYGGVEVATTVGSDLESGCSGGGTAVDGIQSAGAGALGAVTHVGGGAIENAPNWIHFIYGWTTNAPAGAALDSNAC